MIPSNMTEKDWGMFLGAGGIQDDCILSDQNEIPLYVQPTKKITLPDPDKKHEKKINVLSLGRATTKAKFFVTEDSAFHAHGFWCPNKVLISYEANCYVIVKDWFEPKIIEWD